MLRMKKLFLSIFEILFIWTLILLLGYTPFTEVFTGKDFPMLNIHFLLIGGALLTVTAVVNNLAGDKAEAFLTKHEVKILGISLPLLFLLEFYLCYGGFFHSGWDAGVVNETAFREFAHLYDKIWIDYFSWYPNNLLIIWIFTGILNISSALGIPHGEVSILFFQCLIDASSIYLVYAITKEITGSRRTASFAYWTGWLFTGLSPWFIVAYSDATGIVLPLLIVRLYQKQEREEKTIKRIILWSSMGIISVISYLIKPQLLIVTIAVVIVGALKFIRNTKISECAVKAVSAIGGSVVMILIYSLLIVPSLNMNLDPDKAMGFPHYIMMGLNDERDGVYHKQDFDYSSSFATPEERNEADMKEVQNRIKEYGVDGMVRHMNRKQMVNYGDGTFAWAVEGHSFDGDPKWAHNGASEIVRSLIKPEGKNYNLFISTKQVLWISILFLLLFVPIYKKKSGINEDQLLVLVLAVIGLSVFELLFEARARYLFCYAPVFVILAGVGARNLFRLLRKRE